MAISGVPNFAKAGGTGWGNLNQTSTRHAPGAPRFPSTPVNSAAASTTDPAKTSGICKPDVTQFNTIGPHPDMWELAKQSGNYGSILQMLDPAFVNRRYDEISSRLAHPGVYDPSNPFDGGLSASAVQSLQAEGDRYKAALDWQAANPNWTYHPPAR